MTEEPSNSSENNDEEFIEDSPEDFFPNYDDTALEDIDPEDIELPPSDIEYDDYADYDEEIPLSDENLAASDEVDLLNDLDRILEEDLIDEVTEDSQEVIEDPSSDPVPEINPEHQQEVAEVEPEVEEEDEIERQMREAREKIEALQREKERRSTTPEPATEEIIPEAEPEAETYQEIAEDPNEVDQREILEEVPEEKFEDFENIQANAEDWGIEDPEVITEDLPPKMDEEIEGAEEVLQDEINVKTFDQPPTPNPEVYNEEHEDILDEIPSPTDLPYEDDSIEDVIINEEPTDQNQPEDFQETKNETNDEEEIRRRYQGKIKWDAYSRRLNPNSIRDFLEAFQVQTIIITFSKSRRRISSANVRRNLLSTEYAC